MGTPGLLWAFNEEAHGKSLAHGRCSLKGQSYWLFCQLGAVGTLGSLIKSPVFLSPTRRGQSLLSYSPHAHRRLFQELAHSPPEGFVASFKSILGWTDRVLDDTQSHQILICFSVDCVFIWNERSDSPPLQARSELTPTPGALTGTRFSREMLPRYTGDPRSVLHVRGESSGGSAKLENARAASPKMHTLPIHLPSTLSPHRSWRCRGDSTPAWGSQLLQLTTHGGFTQGTGFMLTVTMPVLLL